MVTKKDNLEPEVIKKMAQEEGLMLIQDSKFGRENYTSVQCSWPQLIRLVRKAFEMGRKS